MSVSERSASVAPGAASAFAELMGVRGLGDAAAAEVGITGHDPFYRTPLRVGEAAAAVLGAIGVASNDLWEARTGRRQQVSVDATQAAATIRTVDYTEGQKPDGSFEHIPIPQGMKDMIAATQPWPTKDGSWVLPHLNLPHLKDRVLGVLGAEFTPPAVKEAVGRWDADALEEAIAAANGCGGRVRSPEEWLAHPQGRYLAARPVVEITKVAEGPPVPLRAGDRPASGVRVLDFTRILAGPIGGRTLAEHGAEVLMVGAGHLPQTPEHVRDTSHGKRSCFLDLRDASQAARAQQLAREADIVIGGYRPGRLSANGLGPEIAAEKPGRIYMTISCFGSGGPFAGRSGWEQVAQVVTGIAHVHGKAIGDGTPQLVFAPVCDYLTGYLAGYGALLALGRRMREGGSYHVNVSLCQSGMFLLRQGTVAGFENAPDRLTRAQIDAMHVTSDTSYGRLKTIGPVLRMSETSPHWARPTPAFGGDAPEWLAA
ncbi:CoA transferase [Neoroseomonas terrae]|nr:CoA transferase [Neoroseomonas terrae]